jgi:hypothetical protein
MGLKFEKLYGSNTFGYTALCHGSSFCATLKGTKCCHMSCFSSRKFAEKALVVVTTRFCPSVLETAATTGSLIPLSENALLRAFLVARGEKSALVLVIDLTSISRFWVFGFVGLEGSALFLFPTVVHSWGLAVLVAPWDAILAKAVFPTILYCNTNAVWVWLV